LLLWGAVMTVAAVVPWLVTRLAGVTWLAARL
jgi:hypothetical protein